MTGAATTTEHEVNEQRATTTSQQLQECKSRTAILSTLQGGVMLRCTRFSDPPCLQGTCMIGSRVEENAKPRTC